MIRRITTESGSVYVLDTVRKTWQRTRGIEANVLRSDEGTYLEANDNVKPENCLVLRCPLLPDNHEPGAEFRYILSTYVVSNEILN